MDFLAESAVAQGMVLASLIGGFALAATVMMINVWSGIIFFMDDGADRPAIAAIFYGGLLIGVVFFALGMAETVAIRTPRLRLPILIMFGSLLLVEVVLALLFLR